jgi:hypothetical protein
MAQINVYEGREWAATGHLVDGRIELEAGNLSRQAVQTVQEALDAGEEFGTLTDGGRQLRWLVVRPGE